MSVIVRWAGNGVSPTGTMTSASVGPGDIGVPVPQRDVSGGTIHITDTGLRTPVMRVNHFLNQNTYVYYTLPTNYSSYSIRFYWRHTTSATGTNRFFFARYNNATSWQIYMNSNHRPFIASGTGSNIVSGTDGDLSSNSTYYRIEATVSGTTLTVRFYSGDSTTLIRELTTTLAEARVDRIEFGTRQTISTVHPNFHYDDILMTDTVEWLGPWTEPQDSYVELQEGGSEIPLTLQGVWNGSSVVALDAEYGEVHNPFTQETYIDLEYVPGSPHSRHKLDLYTPAAAGPHPLIVYAHGGFFIQGSKSQLSSTMRNDMLDANFAVASINYRLAPQPNIFASSNPGPNEPIQIQDFKTAIKWLINNAVQYNIDPTKIIVSGHSAGGYLATMVNYTTGLSHYEIPGGDPEILGSYVFAAPLSLTRAAADFGGSDLAIRSYLGCLWNGSSCSMSPHNAQQFISSIAKPSGFLFGTNDVLVPTSHFNDVSNVNNTLSPPSSMTLHTHPADHDSILYSYNKNEWLGWMQALL